MILEGANETSFCPSSSFMGLVWNEIRSVVRSSSFFNRPDFEANPIFSV
jgi:hypothetical protein